MRERRCRIMCRTGDLSWLRLLAKKQKHRFAHRQNFALDLAGRAFAAIRSDAAISGGPSRLDADGVALAEGRACIETMDRSPRNLSLHASRGGCRGRCAILQASW